MHRSNQSLLYCTSSEQEQSHNSFFIFVSCPRDNPNAIFLVEFFRHWASRLSESHVALVPQRQLSLKTGPHSEGWEHADTVLRIPRDRKHSGVGR